MSSLDTFFLLKAAAHFYVDIRILAIEIQRASHVRVEREEVAAMASTLQRRGFLRRLRYNAGRQVYEEFASDSEIEDSDWFEITQDGLDEIDRLWIESPP